MEIIQVIILVLLVISIGLLILVYKNALPAYLSQKGKNLATKQDIADITREIEGTKAIFVEHQFQFSHFNQKRLDAIGEIYELLHDAQEFVMHMVHPVQHGGDDEEKERQRQGIDAFNKFSGFYWKHKIYLPEQISQKTEEILNAMKEATVKYTVARRGDQSAHSLELWDRAFKLMKDSVPQLRTELEKSLREIITAKSMRENAA